MSGESAVDNTNAMEKTNEMEKTNAQSALIDAGRYMLASALAWGTSGNASAALV